MFVYLYLFNLHKQFLSDYMDKYVKFLCFLPISMKFLLVVVMKSKFELNIVVFPEALDIGI